MVSERAHDPNRVKVLGQRQHFIQACFGEFQTASQECLQSLVFMMHLQGCISIDSGKVVHQATSSNAKSVPVAFQKAFQCISRKPVQDVAGLPYRFTSS